MAESLLDFFAKEGTKDLLERLRQAGVNMIFRGEEKTNIFLGKIFVVTGTLPSLSRAEAEDVYKRQILICIQTNKTVNDDDVLEFGTDEFYVKSTDEMYALFSAWPEACENTNKIAEQCNFDFEFGVTKLPYFEAPDGEDNRSYFIRLCEEGLQRRYGPQAPDEVRRRLDYEISVIDRMGYVNYYLIVYDFINYARQRGIPVGPGRGSGAGSLADVYKRQASAH